MNTFGSLLAEIMRRWYIAEIDVARAVGVCPKLVRLWLEGAVTPTPDDVLTLARLVDDADARRLRAAARQLPSDIELGTRVAARHLCDVERELLAGLPEAFRAPFAAAFCQR